MSQTPTISPYRTIYPFGRKLQDTREEQMPIYNVKADEEPKIVYKERKMR